MNKRFCLVLALLFMIISLSAFAQTSGDPGEKGESKQKLSGKEASGAADENITRFEEIVVTTSPLPNPVTPLVSRYATQHNVCLLYTSPSPRDRTRSRMPSSA